MTRPTYYGVNSEPLEMSEWAELVELRTDDMSPESWWRKRTQLDGDVEVSTVWLGIDHNFTGHGPPLVWETMIFGGDYSEHQWRYTTRQQAYDDHELIVRALRAGRNPEEVEHVRP